MRAIPCRRRELELVGCPCFAYPFDDPAFGFVEEAFLTFVVGSKCSGVLVGATSPAHVAGVYFEK